MNSADVFSELASHISWGRIKKSHQVEALQALQSSPALATAEDEFGETLLMIAAGAANLEVVNQLCLLGSDVSAVAATGDTPLICAVRGACDESPEAEVTEARTAIIDTLIRFGAAPDQLGWQGCSALHFAVMYGFVELVRHLLVGGADPKARICDPPSNESAIELAESERFYGSENQRHAIIDLLKRA